MIPKLPLNFGKLNYFDLWKDYIFTRWSPYVIGTLSILLTNITEIFVPKLVQYFLDFLQKDELPSFIDSNSPLFHFGVLFIAILLIQTVFRSVWRFTMARESHYSSAMFKSLIWDRVRFFPKSALEHQFTTGNLMNIATSDISISRFLFGFTLVGVVNSLFLAPLSLYFMFQIDKEITLYTLTAFLFLPLLVYRLMERYVREYEESQEKLGELNEVSSSSVANIKLQKLSASAVFWFDKLKNFANVCREYKYKVAKTSVSFILVFESAPIISYAFIFTIGLHKLLEGQLSIGEFVALQSYTFLLQVPFADLGFIIGDFKRGFTSMKRLIEVYNQKLDERFEVTEGAQANPDSYVYEIKNLSFSYEKEKIIDQLNLQLREGEWLGIKGPVGAGKSTLLELLLGFRSDYSGSISLFGNEVNTYSMEQLRSWISYVPQKNFLFADSIKNNLQLQNEFTKEDIDHALGLADMTEDIEELKDRGESFLGEDGVNLSGGQKQRLSIARAVAQKNKILIMDDCLSAVDTVTEEKILQAFKKHLQGTTIIWTAHRDSTLKYCHQVLELK